MGFAALFLLKMRYSKANFQIAGNGGNQEGICK